MYKIAFLVFWLFSFVFVAQAKEDSDIPMRPMHHASKDLSGEGVLDGIANLIIKYRKKPVVTWWYHAGSLFSKDALAVINLHHLAGNIHHIITALVNEDYYQHIRICEWSQHLRQQDALSLLFGKDPDLIHLRADDGDVGNRMTWSYYFKSRYTLPDDLVVGRNCLDDLWLCIDVLRKFDSFWQRGASISDDLYKRLEAIEKDLALYREQRKISFRAIYARNEGKCGHDDDVPDSIRFGERNFLGKIKFERKKVPFVHMK